MSEVKVPPSEYESSVLGFCKEAMQEGDAFIKAQDGYGKIAQTVKQIMGDKLEIAPTTLSGTSLNHVAKTGTDLVSLLTDIKQFWEYKTENKRFEPQSTLYGKLSTHWYKHREIDLRMATLIQLVLAGGTAFAHQVWSGQTQDIDMLPEDPRDVLPIRPSSNLTLQDAFGVIVRRERTVNYLRRLYPSKAASIKPDRDGSTSLSVANTRVGRLMDSAFSPFREYLFGQRPAASNLPRVPVCDLYTMYLDDRTEHSSDSPRYMGDWEKWQGTDEPRPLNNWSYVVRKGELLYPRKRLVIFTSTSILYDGPSIYWHGLFPLSKITLDPWPWSWLGKGLLWDVLSPQRALDKALRVVDDHFEKLARPDVLADRNSLAKASLDRIDTRRAGLKVRFNAMAGKDSLSLRYPDPLPQYVMTFIQFYIEQIRTLSGAADATQLMRLNQLPSSDTVEKIMEAMSPAIRLRSRYIESFVREFALMLAYNFTQFYTVKRRFMIAGDTGVLPEDFDFDPGSMIPDFPHAEDTDEEGKPTALSLSRGLRPRYERAREFLRQFSFSVAQSSLLAASEIERKLLYLQLSRAGLVDHWTLLETLGIPNVGNPPTGANTITERLMAESQMGIGMAVSSAGRKASGQEMPRMKMSESG